MTTAPDDSADQVQDSQPFEWTEPLALQVSHLTRYHYHDVTRDSYNEARLRPLNDSTQTCVQFRLDIDPVPVIRDYPDFYGNHVHYFDVVAPHHDLSVLALSIVHTHPDDRGPIPADNSPEALNHLPTVEDHFAYMHSSAYVSLDPEIWKASMDALPEEPIRDMWQAALAMGRFIHQNFAYTPQLTTVNTHPVEVLAMRKGVCQDFAHLLLGMCRSRHIPARYVSGYFYNPHKKPGEIEASHAWIEVYLPNYGWKGYDPTHDRVPDTRYVKLAVGADYGDIRPLSGSFRGKGTREMIVEVHIDRLPEGHDG